PAAGDEARHGAAAHGRRLPGAPRGAARPARRTARRSGLTARVVCLPGDGIGPEVMAEAVKALRALELGLELEERPFGGPGIRECGDPFPPATREACLAADAVLLAAVGSPEYERAEVRPEQGLLRLRGDLGAFAN